MWPLVLFYCRFLLIFRGCVIADLVPCYVHNVFFVMIFGSFLLTLGICWIFSQTAHLFSKWTATSSFPSVFPLTLCPDKKKLPKVRFFSQGRKGNSIPSFLFNYAAHLRLMITTPAQFLQLVGVQLSIFLRRNKFPLVSFYCFMPFFLSHGRARCVLTS
jgi:hypothetical protein